ncbi:Iroquois-class homeodomain protein IRX-3,Iroquois-class homeodomain protein irx-4-A,Iroquois-class homeodomain protein irx-5,Iroquois-class homeodomain protein IRX-4,Iroquois-class homeodomain protein IRX-5,Iroquois-class homeodomain protein IRX-6,Iroquois-class homeodomain protein irx-4,Iroquois-class homeodomain protein IRX-1,Iroquois-class homeodomain protein irx-1-B,Iroquois-class homeodomain protein irx-3,Iroquois-class homeodomain protein IRX-2,Iroquois-class homeodomain protein irx-2,Iroquois-class|uniref:Uncharacterized protein n=1 Tax=Lepeophtheirus salmonis TaxID=72036 RepID=A0A7R8D1T6_LEPSM|nr:Iroquois-class homeodomain protein IRX-3,Iroquois-class homeodomain protein irx-4-A,Iroquois-class homeodomain protein irx-5,Iroquois-class homeodomain protein IRX-4,Iroquois-class homeodomain protein IRX-5,Iroquois-class homeodomain protein IRX-6,Iroquois-class homeodomain protein irx-4,Iroquois-class homeodomain protein IRX-1,Iroquois-class homeodomain protein irx-1-B,Iroquois-class homeodomain protein irx-3,Iroquois-class homeodomain protein IRX-2,Iroquois-class homeodomain protein irx-2,Iroq
MSFPSSTFGYSPYNPQILTQPRSSLSPGSTASNNSSHPPNNESRLSSGSPKSPLESSSSSSTSSTNANTPTTNAATIVSSPISSPATNTSEASSDPASACRLAAINLSPAAAAAAAALGPVYSLHRRIRFGKSICLKDAAEMNAAAAAAWSAGAIPPTACYYSYDHPSLAAYGYGGGYDLASRRKNATRESTATLKAWLNEHKKNPYPTKGEKIMLAIITKMTLTQVSTWFANARRRLKKENKMTWEPKNKLDDEDVDISDDEDKDREDYKQDEDKLTHLVHDDNKSSGIPLPPTKPKIWSLADTAVCKTPPPPSAVGPAAAVAAGLMGWNSPYSHHPVRPMSAFRSGVFGLPRPDFFNSSHMSSMGIGGLGPAGGAPASSSSSSSNQDPSSADTPPHTPPNIIKNGLLGAGFNGLSYLSNASNSPSVVQPSSGAILPSGISPNLDYNR